MKEDYDGAEPAASSIALANLWRLAGLTSGEVGPTVVSACRRTLTVLVCGDAPGWLPGTLLALLVHQPCRAAAPAAPSCPAVDLLNLLLLRPAHCRRRHSGGRRPSSALPPLPSGCLRQPSHCRSWPAACTC